MPNYRKTVRDAVRTVLSAESTGINASATSTGLLVDWLEKTNILEGYIDPEAAEVEKLIELPGLVIYTSEAVNDHVVKGFKFSGQVLAHAEAYLQYRKIKREEIEFTRADAWETRDFETPADAMEEALLTAIAAGSATFTAAGVRLVGYRVTRDPVQLYGDGWGQRIALTMQCNLEAN